MTPADAPPDTKTADPGLAPLAIVALIALYAITHPFAGFTGDAQIYLGRALADNDPMGVGRDLMYRLDGQSRFSIFPLLAAVLVAHMSLLTAAMCIVAASSLLWFMSALAVARSVAPGRWLAVAAVIVLAPPAYGGFNLLRYAETLAEPRPFAEAFVMFAVAAFLAQRRIVALACLAAAALFHPIMAFAGVATLALVLCMTDRRWLVASVAAFVAVAIAAFLGAPVADRLRIVIDPEWLALLSARNAYLLPHLWPSSSWALPAVQAITILMAARCAAPATKRVLVSGLIAGAAGLAVAYIAARFDPVLLVMQAQLWRIWWLTAVLAALSLGLLAVEIGARSASQKLALAMLALAWALSQEAGLYAPLIAAIALVVDRLGKPDVSDEIERAMWLGAGVAVVGPLAVDLPFLKFFAGEFQSDFTPSVMPLALKFLAPPLLFGAIAVAAFGLPSFLHKLPVMAMSAAVVALAAIAGVLWDDASTFDKALGSSPRRADLQALMPEKSGEVLWLYSSLEPWVWLGRPGWSADMQGAGSVFSRELAMTYADRARAQIDSGLRDETMLRRVPYKPKTFHPALTLAGVDAICRRADAPAYIVAPLAPDAAPNPALNAKIWTAPAPRVEILYRDDGVDFPRLDRYAIIDCAGRRR